MARKPPTNTEDELLKHIGNEPHGVGIDELLRLMAGDVSRRTLQRRLSVLIDAGRLKTDGAGRSTRYRLPALH
jgi:DNA-binding IclR family transcriptional regulator